MRGVAALWLAVAGPALVPARAAAQDRGWEWGMHPMWWMWGAGGIAMMLAMLVFWGIVITAVVLGVRWLVSAGREPLGREPRRDPAVEILRERYARGEISREEFEARKRDLA